MNNSEEEKQDLEKAGTNTAHVALKVAAETFAPGVGGKVYNVASKVPIAKNVVKGAERLGGQVISKTPVVNKLNKKLNDNGVVDTAGKAVDAVSGTPIGNQKKNIKNSNSQNKIQRPTGNRAFNSRPNQGTSKPNLNDNANNSGTNIKPTPSSVVPKALQRRKENGGFLNRLGLGLPTILTNTEETQEESHDETSEETGITPSLVNAKTRRTISLIIKLIPALLPVLVIVAFLVIIVVAIAYPAAALSSFFSLNSYGTENQQYVYTKEEDEKNYEAEVKYNEAIRGSNGIVQKYQEKYGVTIDWVLLHTVLNYRYTIANESDLYSSDGNDAVSDEELNERLEGLESDSEESSDTSGDTSMDYGEAEKKIKTVASLMITKNGDGTYSADTTVGGNFYNTLIDSSFLKSYYKDFLVDDSYETRKALVDDIFEEYAANKEVINSENGVGTDGLYFQSQGNFNGQIQLNEEYHYHQGNYSQSWCAGSSISASGCSLTSAAIAISLLKNQKITPIDLNKTATGYGNCRSYSYSRNNLIVRLAKSYNLSAYQINKKNESQVTQMLQELASGNTVVIARLKVNNGRYSTSAGHYVAVVGVKTESDGRIKVLVWDPATTSKSRDNYWADFNDDILKYVRSDTDSFMIFSNNGG